MFSTHEMSFLSFCMYSPKLTVLLFLRIEIAGTSNPKSRALSAKVCFPPGLYGAYYVSISIFPFLN